MKPTKILMLINDCHMGLSHQGLTQLAMKFGKHPQKLEPGELLMFINKRRDKLKVYGHGNVIGYLAMPRGQRISMAAIQYIPSAFSPNGRIDYDLALARSLEGVLKAKDHGATAKPELVYKTSKRGRPPVFAETQSQAA